MSQMRDGGNVDRIRKLDTATISDALDRHGIAGQCLGIRPVDLKMSLAGRARTLRYGPIDPAAPGNVGDYIDDVAAGTVLVLDNAGRFDATVWGDILTLVAHRRGVAGTVIDGPCRDVRLSIDIGYPLFSRSISMRTGKDRVQLIATDEPVTIGGAHVASGDLLRGDADGVVVIPRAFEEEVIATAELIADSEDRIREMVQSGMRLDEARAANRYHSLQSKNAPGKS